MNRFLKWRTFELTAYDIDKFWKGDQNQGNLEAEVENSNCLNSSRLPLPFDHMGFDPVFSIKDDNFTIDKKSLLLGRGRHSKIYNGVLHDETVAVKVTRSKNSAEYTKSLLAELKTLCYVGSHEHLLLFYGAGLGRVKQNVVTVIMELSPLGNLDKVLKTLLPNYVNLLKKDRTIAKLPPAWTTSRMLDKEIKTCTLDLLQWCAQIASAMSYLESKQVIHGDLASKNVYLFQNNTVKKPVRWRWMAAETLNWAKVSHKSDVWSFGVTVWEIFTFGQIPFSGIKWRVDFPEDLAQGTRLLKPTHAPQNIYDELLKCWSLKPNSRPSFEELYTVLITFL